MATKDAELRMGREEAERMMENYALAEERFGIEAVSRARGVAWEVTRHRCIDHRADLCYGDMDAIVAAAIGTLLRVSPHIRINDETYGDPEGYVVPKVPVVQTQEA